jgi:hypothetical protein
VLRFRPDGTFTIVQFTDLHWRNGDATDARTQALMEEVLHAERPDLVALTGDIVSGNEAKDAGAAFGAVIAPIEARALPWAAVFGNHDDEGRLSRRDLMAVLRKHPLGLTEAGPRTITGIGNYVLRIFGGRGSRLRAALYFLDSGAHNARGIGHYAWIERDQIAWFLRQSRALGAEFGRGKLPALAFFHIPLPEWDEMWRTRPCRGHRHEPVCSPGLNSGFFAAMVEAGDVMGAFCGHDHVNDFEGELHGLRLAYGRTTGFGEYGREGFPRGARVIRLREGERTFETWVRVEGGARAPAPEHEPEAWTRAD